MISSDKFEDYIKLNEKKNLHPKLSNLYKNFPDDIRKLNNTIFYGPPGIGKYTQMLSTIKKYSPSNLQYEKKICIRNPKQDYYIKISDIHFEIDIAMLGCNSKTLWNDIYTQIVDILLSTKKRSGIIVCKNFQDINSELLEIFYSYLQTFCNSPIHISFIFITTQLSFLPDCIIDCCNIINISRPTRTQYNKCINNKLDKSLPLDNIINIKNIINNITQLNNIHHNICDKIIKMILNINNTSFIEVRDGIYNIFIYNLDIGECLWYIIDSLIRKNNIKKENTTELFYYTTRFLQYFNNNYRPIYHLESFIFYLIKTVHGIE
jgi:hypothetical protein